MNSFGSNGSYCLICCSDSTNDLLEITSSNSSTRTSRLIKATEKIFQCLNLPQEHFQKVKDNNWMSFCSKCILIMDEIIELQRKSEILDLEIQWKAETLGRIAIIGTVPGSKGNNGKGEEKVAEVGNAFKVPVTRNFLQGLLPNPSVKLRKTVNVDTKAVIKLGQIRDVIYSGDPKSSKSTTDCTRSGELAASEIDEVDDRASHSSIWDIWEEPIKTEADEEMVKVEVTDEIQDEEYDSNDDLFEVVTLLPVGTARKETSKEELELFENMEITFPQDQQNKCYTVTSASNKNPIESTPEISIVENYNEKTNGPAIGSISKKQKKILDPKKVKKRLNGLIEGRDYFKCTKCDFFAKKTSQFIDNKPSRLRKRVAHHYSSEHNPVNPSNVSQSVDGRNCYLCTKCNFSICIPQDTHSSRENCHQKLSSHYMEFHDTLDYLASENGLLISPIEGMDYFSCHFVDCKFLALIQREGNEKQQLGNAIEARQKIIEHFRLSSSHLENRKDSFPNLSLVVGNDSEHFYTCSKCEFKSFVDKCGRSRDARDKAAKTLKIHFLQEHIFPWENFPGLYKYGCYQEKLCDSGMVLKCTYLSCDYFINIEYDLVGKTQEECELATYHSFIDKHAKNHNFNSVTFEDVILIEPDEDIIEVECFPKEIKEKNQELKLIENDEGVEAEGPINKRPQRSCVAKKLNVVSNVDEDEMIISDLESEGLYNDESEIDFSSSDPESDREQNREWLKTISKFSKERKTQKVSGSTSKPNAGLKIQNKYKNLKKAQNLISKPNMCIRRIRTKNKLVEPTDSDEPEEIIPEGLTEGKDFLRCPKCKFVALCSKTKEYKKKSHRRRYCRRKLAAHYAKKHNLVAETDFSKTPDGDECYKCTKCSFNTVIRDTESSESMRRSYYSLSLHYMDVHDAFATEISQKDSNIDKFKNLIEAVDYHRCPDPNCNFYVMIDRNKIGGRCPVLLSRFRVVNHFNSCHNPELANVLLKSVLDEAVGIVCFRCSKCDFKSVVEKNVTEAKARRIMKFHFKTKHIQPWRSLQKLYKYKITEEKQGEDEVVRCSHPGCDFFTKIKYVEGKSQEECRYRAYTGIRLHSRFHDGKTKSHLDKGHTGKSLPLYKGNEKFVFPLTSISSVQDKCITEDESTSNSYENFRSGFPITSEKTNGTRINQTDTCSVTINIDAAKDTSSIANADDKTEDISLATIESDLTENKSSVAISTTGTLDHTSCVETMAGETSIDNHIRRSKRTSAIKRKRYNAEDFVISPGDNDVENTAVNDETFEDEGESDNSIEVVESTSRRKRRCKLNNNETKNSLASNGPSESPKYPENDHYRCWKCDFYIEVNYQMCKGKKNIGLGLCRQNARYRLSIHFNATHNNDELAFHDPDKLKVIIDGKDCFRCPRCEHYEEIRFNPKKHVDKIQGRKNARVNLGKHFFFIHCLPERPSSPIPEVDVNPQKDNEMFKLQSAKDSVTCENEQEERPGGAALCNLEVAEGSILKALLLKKSSSECFVQSTEQVLASDNNESALAMPSSNNEDECIPEVPS